MFEVFYEVHASHLQSSLGRSPRTPASCRLETGASRPDQSPLRRRRRSPWRSPPCPQTHRTLLVTGLQGDPFIQGQT